MQRRVPVIIEIDEAANLQPGYEVRAEIKTVQRDEVVLIPREAVRLDENGNYQVMAVVNKRVQYRLIEVGEKNQQWAEVQQGIKAGDTVIRDGSLEIVENSRVKPISKK